MQANCRLRQYIALFHLYVNACGTIFTVLTLLTASYFSLTSEIVGHNQVLRLESPLWHLAEAVP